MLVYVAELDYTNTLGYKPSPFCCQEYPSTRVPEYPSDEPFMEEPKGMSSDDNVCLPEHNVKEKPNELADGCQV